VFTLLSTQHFDLRIAGGRNLIVKENEMLCSKGFGAYVSVTSRGVIPCGVMPLKFCMAGLLRPSGALYKIANSATELSHLKAQLVLLTLKSGTSMVYPYTICQLALCCIL
jgi:hypothetical protein